MSAPLTVRKVETPADLETFLTFPWRLYAGDPHWTPPLVSMQRHKLDKAHNTTWQHLTGDYFVAWRGAEPVGTIAAFVNHRHNEFHGENVGFFGLFEVVEDRAVAHALLDTASDFARAHGLTALRGPVSFSTNEESGVLITGYDDPPLVLMPYNFPYYQDFLEHAPGFRPAMDLLSFRLTLRGALENNARVERAMSLSDRNSARRGITVRTIDRRHLGRDFEVLRTIYNQAWAKNWGFVPFSDAELDELTANLGKYVEPSLTFFAEVKGQPAGFLVTIPDLNQALHAAYPRPNAPELLAKLRVFWHWKLRSKITRIRVPLMGVMRDYWGLGVEAAMFIAFLRRAMQLGPRNNWEYADGGWVLETNDAMIRLCEAHNGTVYKRFRLYERAL